MLEMLENIPIGIQDAWTEGYNEGYKTGSLSGIVIVMVVSLILYALYKWLIIYYKLGMIEIMQKKK